MLPGHVNGTADLFDGLIPNCAAGIQVNQTQLDHITEVGIAVGMTAHEIVPVGVVDRALRTGVCGVIDGKALDRRVVLAVSAPPHIEGPSSIKVLESSLFIVYLSLQS